MVLVIALLVIAQRFGVFAEFRDPERARETLVQLGPWGYLVFVLAYAALQPFGVPGTVFVLAAPLIWPWPVAYALSMTGTMAASVVGFSFSRFVARDWLAPKIPARFRKYDQALESHAFRTVVVLRFIFWMPQLLHAFLGLSKVRFWTHFWGSLVGYALPLLVLTYFGEKLFVAMKRAPVEAWIAVGLAAVAVVVGVWAVRRRRP